MINEMLQQSERVAEQKRKSKKEDELARRGKNMSSGEQVRKEYQVWQEVGA